VYRGKGFGREDCCVGFFALDFYGGVNHISIETGCQRKSERSLVAPSLDRCWITMNKSESDKKGVEESAQSYQIELRDAEEPNPAADSGFVERMQKCAERAGSVNALARKADLSQSGIRRYFSGGEPTRKVLIAIANAAGVDFLWLATGEGAMVRGEAPEPLPAPVRPKLNPEALRLAIETVEESLADTGRRLPPDRKAEMVTAAYELFTDGEGKIEKSVVLRLVKSAT
jgi:DNA-binding phage protein